ncbi:MAG: ATP-grasp domain-containing protein [Candidatus Omnitrophica bacterium]|nr:ATP-grasp domain-containing protein [Candidatus Omnitrophota bacterium]MCB9769415.1 ATP-grasp domain-containing protein [Candidatus Omnitrophota bacterium]MCB9782257.1 ATP-grasp domain-containing protein [Candidatus Omnitrophota bacterium]
MSHPWKEILGLNARNRRFVYPSNDRHTIRIANDKLMARARLEQVGIPMPILLGRVVTLFEIKSTLARISNWENGVVVKPNWGSGGRGILFLTSDGNGGFVGGRKGTMTSCEVDRHLRTVLSGEYSLRSGMDKVVIEDRVRSHPDILALNEDGAPDIRVLCVGGNPLLAMARVPTRRSCGKANLHQGAIGVGLDMQSGQGLTATWKNRFIDRHPDTGLPIKDLRIPHWEEVLKIAKATCAAVPLGYAGVDIMVDREKGPLVLEINARPGLAIQLANSCPLRPLLEVEKHPLNGVSA